MTDLRIGTCSWKYASWKDLVYSQEKNINYLAEYALKYDTVEIDQWFWSLFGDKIELPKLHTVLEYRDSVPEDFRFTVKAPNAITLTHHYPRYTAGVLQPNDQFLSIDLLHRFLDRIEPLLHKVGNIMFQFEYLNRQKMPTMQMFIDKLADFFTSAPKEVTYSLEPRNPQIFTHQYFTFLQEYRLAQVFLQGYFMPPITEIYWKHRNLIQDEVIIRLHGNDRKGIEERTGKKYHRIVDMRDDELTGVIKMVQDLRKRGIGVYLNVNNHYEGSAPLTIDKIGKMLDEKE